MVWATFEDEKKDEIRVSKEDVLEELEISKKEYVNTENLYVLTMYQGKISILCDLLGLDCFKVYRELNKEREKMLGKDIQKNKLA